MFNFASLVAEQDALKSYKKIFKGFDIEKVTPSNAAKILSAFKTLQRRNTLLNRHISFNSEDDALLFCWAELEIERHIKREKWSNGKITYVLQLKTISVPANTSMIGALTLNKMLLCGYQFDEHIGEHFVIAVPKSGVRTTSGTNCTCGTKKCNHLIAVKEILSNRRGCKGLYTISG